MEFVTAFGSGRVAMNVATEIPIIINNSFNHMLDAKYSANAKLKTIMVKALRLLERLMARSRSQSCKDSAKIERSRSQWYNGG